MSWKACLYLVAVRVFVMCFAVETFCGIHVSCIFDLLKVSKVLMQYRAAKTVDTLLNSL